MSPDITRLLVGADKRSSLADSGSAARVLTGTPAVTAPSTANDRALSAPLFPPEKSYHRARQEHLFHAERDREEVRKGITAIIPRLAGPFDPMNGRYNREESVIGHSCVMVLRMRVASPACRAIGRAWRESRRKSSFTDTVYYFLRSDWRVCLGGPGEPSGVVRRPRPRPPRLADGSDALGARRRGSPAREKGYASCNIVMR